MCFCVTVASCVRTVTETKIEYVKPEIPDSITSPCEDMPIGNLKTNGELLMSYITLQSMYATCAAKVNSIRMILLSNESIYKSDSSSYYEK